MVDNTSEYIKKLEDKVYYFQEIEIKLRKQVEFYHNDVVDLRRMINMLLQERNEAERILDNKIKEYQNLVREHEKLVINNDEINKELVRQKITIYILQTQLTPKIKDF